VLIKHTILKYRAVRSRAARFFAYAGFAVISCEPISAAEVSSRPPPVGLTIAILDLAEAPGLAPVASPEPVRPAWRTSFGSERQNEPETKAEAGGGLLGTLANSDVVLIQGVKAAASLRRLFPPRTWRLIVSRRIITPDDLANADPTTPADATTPTEVTSAELPAVTAIAVKARQSLRVTARALALRLDDATENKQAATVANTATGTPAAATAIRLVDRGRTLWLASVALPASCGNGSSAPCPAWAELDAWRAAKRGAGEATLIGGRLPGKNPTAPSAETPQACVAHGIESDLQSQILPPAEAIQLSQTGTGCISIVRIDG
jgi:hypothetical protein